MGHSLWKEVGHLAQTARDVWQVVPRNHKFSLAGASGLMTLTSAGNTVIALLLGWLIDRVHVGTKENWSKETFYRSALIALGSIAVIYVLREATHVWRRYLVENTCTRISRDTQTRLVAHTLKSDLTRLGKERVGALHGKIIRSVDGLVRFLRIMFLDCLPAIFTGLFALLAAVTKHPLLGLVMLGVVPLSVWLTIRQLNSQRGVRLDLMRDCERVDGTVVEQLGGAEYIRVANTVPAEVERLYEAAEQRRRREIRHHFAMSLYGCAKALNEGFFHVIVLGTTTYLAVNGQLGFGDILTFSVLFLNVMAPLNEVHRVLDEGHDASLRVNDLVDMLNQPEDPSFVASPPAELQLKPGEPAIDVRNLSASYVTAEGELKQALRGISLCIRHGETIGVAGPSGSGKSTWIRVLLRLLHPAEGEMRVGGLPIDCVGRCEIAHLVGYVGQNPFVHSGTVRDNITYGNDDATEEQIIAAAQAAHLHDEIMAMPNGYDTELTERGNNLSGGQRQRLAIARILLKCPPVLVLDEATSALDNISERIVQRALGVNSDERTTIIIAHRLSTLKDCDRILVFNDGEIVEEGTYDDLVRQGGLFAELVTSAEVGIDGTNTPHPLPAALA